MAGIAGRVDPLGERKKRKSVPPRGQKPRSAGCLLSGKRMKPAGRPLLDGALGRRQQQRDGSQDPAVCCQLQEESINRTFHRVLARIMHVIPEVLIVCTPVRVFPSHMSFMSDRGIIAIYEDLLYSGRIITMAGGRILCQEDVHCYTKLKRLRLPPFTTSRFYFKMAFSALFSPAFLFRNLRRIRFLSPCGGNFEFEMMSARRSVCVFITRKKPRLFRAYL